MPHDKEAGRPRPLSTSPAPSAPPAPPPVPPVNPHQAPPLPTYATLNSLIAEQVLSSPIPNPGDVLSRRNRCAVLHKRFPWRHDSPNFIQEVYLVLPRAASPATFLTARNGEVHFKGNMRSRYREGDRVCARLVQPSIVGMGTCRWIGQPAATVKEASPMGATSVPNNGMVVTRGPDGVEATVPRFGPDRTWVGVEMDKPVGRHDGKVNGTRYFRTEEKHAVFVLPHQVTLADSVCWEGLPTTIYTPQPSSGNPVLVPIPQRYPIRAWELTHDGELFYGYRVSIELHTDKLSSRKQDLVDHLTKHVHHMHPALTPDYLAVWSRGDNPLEALEAKIKQYYNRTRLDKHKMRNPAPPPVGAVKSPPDSKLPPGGLTGDEVDKYLRMLDQQEDVFQAALALARNSSAAPASQENRGRPSRVTQVPAHLSPASTAVPKGAVPAPSETSSADQEDDLDLFGDAVDQA